MLTTLSLSLRQVGKIDHSDPASLSTVTTGEVPEVKPDHGKNVDFPRTGWRVSLANVKGFAHTRSWTENIGGDKNRA